MQPFLLPIDGLFALLLVALVALYQDNDIDPDMEDY